MASASYLRVVAASVLALACAIGGIAASGGRRAHVLVPVSGGLLAAIALVALIPETAEEIGWWTALAAAALGYLLLTGLDRMGLPVCPSCSHSHGFSGPLVAATAVHAFVDGWGMIAVRNSAGGVSTALLGVLLLHKIPEGLALGAILRMSAQKAGRAVALAIVAESPTLFGGAVALWGGQAGWMSYPLAVAGGAYLFLGLHAVTAWLRPAHHHARHGH